MRECVGDRHRGAAAGRLAGAADDDDRAEAGQLEAVEALEPALVDDQHLRARAADDVAQELALEVDVDGHVDGAGPHDPEPGREVVERWGKHRRDPVAGRDAEACERARDALGAVAQLGVGEVAVDRAHRPPVSEPLRAVVDQGRDHPLAVVSGRHRADATERRRRTAGSCEAMCRLKIVLTRRLGAERPGGLRGRARDQ